MKDKDQKKQTENRTQSKCKEQGGKGTHKKNVYQIVGLEKTLEHPFNCKEIKLINPEGNQPCIFMGRTDAEAEAPILWVPDAKPNHWKSPWCWE